MQQKNAAAYSISPIVLPHLHAERQTQPIPENLLPSEELHSVWQESVRTGATTPVNVCIL